MDEEGEEFSGNQDVSFLGVTQSSCECGQPIAVHSRIRAKSADAVRGWPPSSLVKEMQRGFHG